MAQLSTMQMQAAGPLVNVIATSLGKGRAVQPETAIACISRLAGSLLLRSFALDIKHLQPGSVVLCEEANVKGAVLISIAATLIQRSGFELDAQRAGAKGRGQEPGLSFLESMARLQAPAIEICRGRSLSLEQGAQSAAVATGFIVKECARSIDVEVAFNVAVYGFVEGSKTVPPLLKDGGGFITLAE